MILRSNLDCIFTTSPRVNSKLRGALTSYKIMDYVNIEDYEISSISY